MTNRNDSINSNPKEFSNLNFEEKILNISKNLVPPSGKPEDDILNSLLIKIENPNSGKTIRLRRYWKGVAAVVLMVLGIYTVSAQFFKERVTAKFAQQKEIILPDGSDVVLNAGSKISWSGKQFLNKRELSLNGEAFFDVVRGNQFMIKTPKGTVEILGTQLNVFSRGDNFWVSCISGKVRVTSNRQTQTILSGEVCELTSAGLIKFVRSDVVQTVSWKQGVFYFEDKPLVSIFDELERQFNVSIKFEGGMDRVMTVSFSNKILNEALDIVCIPMGLEYEIINDKKVRIFQKGE